MMVPLGELLTPIGLSALLVLAGSAFVWMVLPHHRGDLRSLPDEAATLEALLSQSLRPGVYRFPHAADGQAMGDPAFAEKLLKGPVGLLTVTAPRAQSMGQSLGLSLLYYLGVSVFVAYATGRALPAGSDALSVFRTAGTLAVATYTGALLPASIWWGRPWGHTLKDAADGVLYGLLTAGAFAWLWPR
jgi:hypothetical protein